MMEELKLRRPLRATPLPLLPLPPLRLVVVRLGAKVKVLVVIVSMDVGKGAFKTSFDAATALDFIVILLGVADAENCEILRSD